MVLETVPLSVRVDAEHGGRWTSLSGGGREWLWHRDEPRREHVLPGDAFADAGGIEECVPTVRGLPDHGDAWSRAWIAGDSMLEHRVSCPDFELTRRIGVVSGSVVADYRLVAEPGYRFLWAGHALLDLSQRAVLQVHHATETRVFPLGPDDGTAVGDVIDGTTAVVDDGPDHRLRLSVQVNRQPTAIALWRNLGGWPDADPYRSIGVEPMLGRVFDLAHADDGDCAVVPDSGEVRWRLTITAYQQKA
ncbi:hypothetical protein [Actinospica sp.]|jgi:hypothetical protein|uniref:hypothetical protein n=1 Tax=Actinospica sp. TaxID=1872142 RepID=UPI002B766C21|nr:hypothetical protein [Actinospica sp.]HWG27534.1 hypothetical protein [Actinospica sp.]